MYCCRFLKVSYKRAIILIHENSGSTPDSLFCIVSQKIVAFHNNQNKCLWLNYRDERFFVRNYKRIKFS